MTDNISRKAAIDAIAEKVFHDLTDEFYGVMQVLNELPTTDRKGHWIAEASDKVLGQLNWSCSECGEGFALDIGKCPSDIGMNFCPHCGADMRGVDDESTL